MAKVNRAAGAPFSSPSVRNYAGQLLTRAQEVTLMQSAFNIYPEIK